MDTGEVVTGLASVQCGLVERTPLVLHHFGVRILFFAQLREATGLSCAEIDCPEVGVEQLWQILEARWPLLAAQRANVRLARNGTYAANDEIFARSDEVALIPPVSGG